MTSSATASEAYRVELPSYSGPLDLLLYLVRRDEIDLHDIPMAQLTQQYLHHLSLIQQIDVDLAGEFLLMAATLLEIKSAMLMPPASQTPTDSDETTAQANPLDPRYELVQQLLAYKRFKDAAGELDTRREDWEARFPVQPSKMQPVSTEDDPDNPSEALEISLEDVSLWDLSEAFARVMESVGRGPVEHEVVVDDTPIALHAEDILDRLKRDGPMTFEAIFTGRRTRSELIGLFLAMLELVKQRAILVTQAHDSPTIQVELCPPESQDSAHIPSENTTDVGQNLGHDQDLSTSGDETGEKDESLDR